MMQRISHLKFTMHSRVFCFFAYAFIFFSNSLHSGVDIPFSPPLSFGSPPPLTDGYNFDFNIEELDLQPKDRFLEFLEKLAKLACKAYLELVLGVCTDEQPVFLSSEAESDSALSFSWNGGYTHTGCIDRSLFTSDSQNVRGEVSGILSLPNGNSADTSSSEGTSANNNGDNSDSPPCSEPDQTTILAPVRHTVTTSIPGSLISKEAIERMQLQFTLMTIRDKDRPDFSIYDLFFKSALKALCCSKRHGVEQEQNDLQQFIDKYNKDFWTIYINYLGDKKPELLETLPPLNLNISEDDAHSETLFEAHDLSDLIYTLWIRSNKEIDYFERLMTEMQEMQEMQEIANQSTIYKIQTFLFLKEMGQLGYLQYDFKSQNGVPSKIFKKYSLLFIFCSEDKIFTLTGRVHVDDVIWGFNNIKFTGTSDMINPMIEQMVQQEFKFVLFLKPVAGPPPSNKPIEIENSGNLYAEDLDIAHTDIRRSLAQGAGSTDTDHPSFILTDQNESEDDTPPSENTGQ